MHRLAWGPGQLPSRVHALRRHWYSRGYSALTIFFGNYIFKDVFNVKRSRILQKLYNLPTMTMVFLYLD